ncbi:tryptophan--tRNA ligase [Buchnera aphidicola]|uniref:Tryptophan--tRNA ligase n=1 Tax=Buchnera aphidicola (Sarucallis kahawaluokalani) TaxID=1241878 RepID=A0A4D6YJJ5_9GAMM|nr:tryptophan--tRNA ligase [Buchnera aphidicola]QCI26144.1 tryptophan--tRNA ligase [Buchnera aphidicola (Sarucallis kahawaluokalani)]
MGSKQVIFSAVQPSGKLTLGNYIGVISHWSNMQKMYNCMYSIADLHAITVKQEKKVLKKQVLDTLAMYLAAGIHPKSSIIFLQSEVKEHCQLYWILNCCTYFGELMRMTQFKSKSKINTKNVNIGLFSYPVLMAADILLYQSDKVLIGKDQIQHIELVRNITRRINFLYGKIMKTPEVYIPNLYSAKIMSLLNPMHKMSKSDVNKNNVIFLLDSIQCIVKKITQAVTDSGNKIFYDVYKKAGISNLLNIYSSLTGVSISELEVMFEKTTYKDFKFLVAKIVSKKLYQLQEKFYYFRNKELYLRDILNDGACVAKMKAQKTIDRIYHAIGI